MPGNFTGDREAQLGLRTRLAAERNESRRSARMTPEEWQRVRPILESALELDPKSRSAFVDNECADDEGLRREVLSLLSNQKQRDHFLKEPAMEMVRQHMAKDQAQQDTEAALALLGKNMSHYRVRHSLGGDVG